MEREIDLLQRVANYLIEHGYPEESIILEWKIKDNLRVDMAIVDNKTKRPVALFEFKRRRDERTDNIAISQLKRYADAIGDPTVPLYIVYGSSEPPYFELYYLTEENDNEILRKIPQIPLFTYLKNSSISKLISKKEKEKEKTYNWFKVVCWLISFGVSIMLFLDFLNIIKITPEKLGILTIIIVLIIIPFSNKLKILGIEFERLQSDK